MKKKEERIELLSACLKKLGELSSYYMKAYPAWTLIQSAWGHIKSVEHLEMNTHCSEKILGVEKKVSSEI